MKAAEIVSFLLVTLLFFGPAAPVLAGDNLIPLPQAAGEGVEGGIELKRLVIFPDNGQAIVPGKTVELRNGARIIDGRIYLPLKTLLALLNGTAYYDPENETIYIWTGSEKADRGTTNDLLFDLDQDGQEVILSIRNPTEKPVSVEFSSRLWTLTLYNAEGKVWLPGDDVTDGVVRSRETWAPGEVRVFKELLPPLPPGLYYAEVRFAGLEGPVAGMIVEIEEPAFDAAALQIDVAIRESRLTGEQRLVITAHNTSAKAVTLPGGMDIVFKRDGREVWRLLEATNYAGLLGHGTISPGASRTEFQKVPDIEPGIYRVEIFYGNSRDPAAGADVRVR